MHKRSRRLLRLLPVIALASVLTVLALPAAPARAASAKVGPGKVTLTIDGVRFDVKADGRVSLAGLKRNLAAAAPKVRAHRTARYLASHRGVAAPRSLLTNYGQRLYSPAMAWTAADGATITASVEYGIEDLPGGCRPYNWYAGFRNGQPWALNFAADDYHLKQGFADLRTWLGTWSRVGTGYTSPSTFYTHSAQEMYSTPFDTRAKGQTESVWHYHYGQSNSVVVTCL